MSDNPTLENACAATRVADLPSRFRFRTTAEGIPNGRLRLLDGAGHGGTVTSRAATAAGLDFLLLDADTQVPH